MAGYTKSSGAGDLDFLVLRLDADGGMIWGRTFGESFHDMAYAITETSDGCFVVAGERRLYSILDEFNLSSSYRYDFGVVKIDSGGDLVWSRTHGGRDYDRANAVVECREGGYAVAGHTQSFGAWYEPEPHAKKDLWILRLDHDGEVLWERLFGAPNGSDGALSMRQCRDGGYIVCGFTSSYGAGSYDCLVLKLDGTGALQWSRTAGGPKFDQAHAVIETSCGRFIAAGETSSWGEGESDGYVLCYDRDGSLLWSRTYGGPSFDRIRSITETAEGTFVLAGYTSSSGAGHKDFWVLTIDGQGRVKRSGTLGLESCDEAFLGIGRAQRFAGGRRQHLFCRIGRARLPRDQVRGIAGMSRRPGIAWPAVGAPVFPPSSVPRCGGLGRRRVRGHSSSPSISPASSSRTLRSSPP